jgi:hypothetical protein
VVETVGLKLKRIKYAAMEGLVGEGNEIIEEVGRGPALDAVLIAADQKVDQAATQAESGSQARSDRKECPIKQLRDRLSSSR